MLKKLILSKLNGKNYTNLEKARFIYIELGKLLSFSTTLQNTSEEEFLKIFFEKVDTKSFNRNQVICRTWSQLYSQLLTECGIKNEIIDRGHSYVEFYIDGKRWVADATDGDYMDLARIKNGEPTAKFGLSYNTDMKHDNSVAHDPKVIDLISKIDEKIGYSDRLRKMEKLKYLLKNIKTRSLDVEKETGIKCHNDDDRLLLKLEYVFTKLGKMSDSYYSSKELVRVLEPYFLTKEEYSRIKGIELKRTNRKKQVDIIQCLSVALSNDEYAYYLLAPNQIIRQASINELVKLAILGYGIDKNTIPGIIYPKKFQKGERNFVNPLRLYSVPEIRCYNKIQVGKIK